MIQLNKATTVLNSASQDGNTPVPPTSSAAQLARFSKGLHGVPLSRGEHILLRIGHLLGTRILFTITIATLLSVLLSSLISYVIRGYVTPLTPILATICCVSTALPIHLVLRAFTLMILRQQKHVIAQQDMLSHLNTQLTQTNSDLAAFSHRVAHDLRNPLAIVKMVTEELSTTELDRQTNLAMLEEIDEAADRAGNIVSAILMLSKARQSLPELVLCSPAQALAEALVGLERKLATAGLQVKQLGDPSLLVTGYPQWLERAWVNLIDNAIKYGSGGENIVVGVERAGKRVRCWVTDEGPGIPSSVRERLSVDFKSSSKGYGIGLAMVAELVEHMGGQVELSDGPGATVSLWFDAAPPPESAAT